MTVSTPYRDPESLTKRSPDWLVVVRKGDDVERHRFASAEQAQAFYVKASAEAAKS